ncbi:reticulocalbin-3-like [Dromaius novaehollandiae]|uniref:reticulocalbin-3-like n=1 Tax=Dromaius novaehollandiae TaxID=8790 RepID=UPI00311E62F2
MAGGGWWWLAALWLAGAEPAGEGGPGRRPPHDHARGFAYDHEAFLGAEGAREFEALPPAESRRRLGLLAGLMDGDGDGAVTAAELGAWLRRRRQRGLAESLSRGRARWDGDGDGALAWPEYRRQAYGHDEDFGDVADAAKYRRLVARDERRFRAADGDGDGTVTGDELAAFLQPEEFEHMRLVVAAETLEDMDKDGDGYVQVDEYIGDMYAGEPGAPEPSWVQTEREQFGLFRDLDGDGRLDAAEIAHWLRPPAADPAQAEAQHLLHEADADQDGQLTKEEILGKWNLFVGSQATSYGEDLTRPHDEL